MSRMFEMTIATLGTTSGQSKARPTVTEIENAATRLWDQTPYFGNTLHTWTVACAATLLAMAAAWVIKRILANRLKQLASRTTTRVDDLLAELIEDLRFPLLTVLAVAVGSRFLAMTPRVDKAIQIAAVAAVALQLVISSRLVIDFLLQTLLQKSLGSDGKPDETVASSLGVLRFLGMLGFGLLILMLALDNIGIAVTPLLTGLGIGGIAVALAVQNVLSDLLASLAILLDKPFVVGDNIQVGTQAGTVERIGIKTTRVRATGGEQLVFANSDLLKGVVQNFKRMDERRVAFNLGVTYKTSPENLRRIPELVKAALDGKDIVRFDRCHLRTFGDWALIFEVVYFVKTPDFRTHVDVQQQLNLALIESFHQHGIEFAFPTQVQLDGGKA
jgi:small-conductance mechanosensitive channel